MLRLFAESWGGCLFVWMLLSAGILLPNIEGYKFLLLLDSADPGSHAMELTARHILDAANNPTTGALRTTGFSLNLLTQYLPIHSIERPLEDAQTVADALQTSNRIVAAFDGAPESRRLPAYILANYSNDQNGLPRLTHSGRFQIPFFSFDDEIVNIARTSFTVDFVPSIWANSTFGALSALGNVSRLALAFSVETAPTALAFIRGSPARNISLLHYFEYASSNESIATELRLASRAGAVYFIIFGSSKMAYTTMKIAAQEDLIFEYIWIACDDSAVSLVRFNEYYAADPIPSEMVSGFVSLSVNTTEAFEPFFSSLKAGYPSVFSRVDERLPYFADAMNLFVESIASILQRGLDPMDHELLYDLTLRNTSRSESAITGEMHWLPNGFRAGTLALQNWHLPTAEMPEGEVAINPTISTVGYCNLNVCSLRDTSLLASIKWTTGSQPNEAEGVSLTIGMAFLANSSMASQWLAAANWAIQRANSEILSFYKLRLQAIELSIVPPEIVHNIEKFKSRSSPAAVVGPLFSYAAKLLASSLQASQIPMITPAATDMDLSNEFYFQFVARVGDTAYDAGLATVQTLRAFRWFAFATLTSSDDKNEVEEIKKLLPSDMRILAAGEFSLNGESSAQGDEVFALALTHIKSSAARVIFYSAHPATMFNVLAVAKSLNMFGADSNYIWVFDKQVLFADLSATGDIRPLTRADFVGTVVVAPPTRPIEYGTSECFSSLQNSLIRAGYSSSPVFDTPDFEPDHLTPYWVDSVLLTAHSIENLFKFEGKKARRGTLLNKYIHETSFNGCTGAVQLSRSGDRVRSTHVTSSFNGSHWVPILVYHNSSGDVSILKPLASVVFGPKFSTGSTPLDRFPVRYSESAGLAITIVTALMQLVLLGSAVVVLRYRKDPLIHASSPLFLCLTLLGISITMATNYVWIGDQSTGSCVAQKFLFYCGFSLAFGALLVKNWRIYVLFNDTSLKIIRITNKQLLGYVGVVCSSFIVLLVLWSSIDPPAPSSSHMSGFWCGSRSSAWEVIVNSLSILGLIAGIGIAILTRKIPNLYKEARYIGWSCYNLVVVLVSGLSLAYFSQNAVHSSTAVVIASFIVLIAFGGVYAIIFGPKFYMMWFDQEKVQHMVDTRTGANTTTAKTGTGTGSFHSSRDSSTARNISSIQRNQPMKTASGSDD